MHRAAVGVRCVGAVASCCVGGVAHGAAEDPPPTLREWLHRGRFGLAVSQGFGCEFQSLGALLGLCDGLGGEAQLRSRLEATSGASSGAKVAAVAAMPDTSIEKFAEGMLALGAQDCFLNKADVVCPLRGGYLGGQAIISHLGNAWGRRTIEAMAIPFGASAFDIWAFKSVNLVRGDVGVACQASGSFPGLFAPQRVSAESIGGGDGFRLLTDCAFFTDASGVAGLRRLESRRLLQICGADWNLRSWLVRPPSTLPEQHADTEVVSLVLQGQTRVLPSPWFRDRTQAAFRGARDGVSLMLDVPLQRGAERGHFICVVQPPPTSGEDSEGRQLKRLVGLAGLAALVCLGRPG
mmetsp:Transcript_26626/g.91648  ORF Transcript_26626/g.91648 Transcript_26626/m.91648 type:complete len:351 (+) Transcript_26626:162-1214(+)